VALDSAILAKEAERRVLAEIGSVARGLHRRRSASEAGQVDRAERAAREAIEYRLDKLWERLRRVRFLGRPEEADEA
jgi:hypothetical protein